jgi:hypothetical protein
MLALLACFLFEKSNQILAFLRPGHMEIHVIAGDQRVRIGQPLPERRLVPYDVP